MKNSSPFLKKGSFTLLLIAAILEMKKICFRLVKPGTESQGHTTFYYLSIHDQVTGTTSYYKQLESPLD